VTLRSFLANSAAAALWSTILFDFKKIQVIVQ